ncbi:hypothetical protein FS749_001452 [Ceratobasidium sp. UAMH 11750]|nr:hypothetical protein FS749_001452 [Ceratobasidium sp. UAMH 11750]
MSSGPPPPKKPFAPLQKAGRFVKRTFHIRPSQPLPPTPAGPFSGSAQNQPPGSVTQPSQAEGALQPAGSSAAPLQAAKRAARVAWARLEHALKTLQQSSDMFPPVKPAVNGLLACIDILEAASQGREEYDALASNLAIILDDLAKHLRESRSIQMSNCVSNIISGIEQQIDAINLKKVRLGPQRLFEAQQDMDDLVGCYRRIEMLFRQLQNNAVLSVWSMTHEQLAAS